MGIRKGCDFDVFAIVSNNTEENKKCRLVFASRAVSYNGIIGRECGFKDLLNVELAPGGGERPGFHYSLLCVLMCDSQLNSVHRYFSKTLSASLSSALCLIQPEYVKRDCMLAMHWPSIHR